MSKDFNEILDVKVETQQVIDPNIFVNQSMLEQINNNNEKVFYANSLFQIVSSIITAPLTTIHTSLQLSIKAHKDLYGLNQNNPESSTQLVKTTRDIQPHEKRKFELLLKSGMVGQNKPFTAPVYGSYHETIQGLAKQGILGFYKGNFLGLVHLLLNGNFKLQFLSTLDYRMDSFWHYGSELSKAMIVLLICSAIDFTTNPIQLLQSRFIIQNRLPNFYIYKSSIRAVKKHLTNQKEFFRGGSGHLYKNLFVLLSQLPIGQIQQKYHHIYFFLTSNIFAYPWITVIRRLQAQVHYSFKNSLPCLG
ncbi:hypothetical protein pb186bvf_008500 [Paramecium bursaria]